MTTPSWVTFLIVLLSVSATYTLPLPPTATPVGWLNFACPPIPLLNPITPGVPASVDTTPSGAIFRMVEMLPDAIKFVLYPPSLTKMFPEASAAIPEQYPNFAALPIPSFVPLVQEPANVDTTPEGVIFRITDMSAT